MRKYDRGQPLIVIHIPKAAGTTAQQMFKAWYGDGYLGHYFNERTGQMPRKYDLFRMHSVQRPILVHGHFNKLRKFGVEDYYPECRQFITILRDPFELAVSSYFFTRKVGSKWKDQSRIPGESIAEYLANSKPNMLNHFPREVTHDNYKEIIEEFFIEIGITEHLSESMRRIARKLEQPYDPTLLGHHNATERDQEVPSQLRERFVESNPLEFELYGYVLRRFLQHDETAETASTNS